MSLALGGRALSLPCTNISVCISFTILPRHSVSKEQHRKKTSPVTEPDLGIEEIAHYGVNLDLYKIEQ
ncbi:hypothetical protein BT96DRAFT_927952 [Gymnopus androsaceus JB14]|uniref:Uncharacterized protein n=1 Tax=Gymnopus androsaceus JB14 TaxID=1447944 RepID=A0A6A4GNG0_9AGAR|nr:hypothetical protein BT96DRAFT_927952 [Gymnopus androsaceus JB14]